MTDRLPKVSAAEAVRVLEKAGFFLRDADLTTEEFIELIK